jgi:hypothetical protein
MRLGELGDQCEVVFAGLLLESAGKNVGKGRGDAATLPPTQIYNSFLAGLGALDKP